MDTTLRLNDFIVEVIQSNGIFYAVDNYLSLREAYYAQQ